MFYHDNQLQYTVRVDKPNPAFAKLLQQAIGGIEGEIRVCLQYLFQAWGNRGPNKYRDMLLDTGTEEIAHIEMLCTAVALNLEGATHELKDKIAGENPLVSNILGGMDPRHVLSSGLAAMAVDANGVPFNGSWVVGSGNIAADMYANVYAESTGRVLATRLYGLTDDPGMKDLLSFLITRDAMHQNQWLAVLEDLGGVKTICISEHCRTNGSPGCTMGFRTVYRRQR
jgi:Mn-containing catalase